METIKCHEHMAQKGTAGRCCWQGKAQLIDQLDEYAAKPTQYLTKQQFTTAKSNLTRVINRHMKTDPQRVIDHVDKQFKTWDDGKYAYPDDWHRWNIARNAAEFALMRSRLIG